MLKGENIIIFSSGDWKTGPSSSQHISINFAKENKVLFIETFGSRGPSLNPEDLRRIIYRLLNWLKGIRRQDISGGQLYIYSPVALIANLKPFLFIERMLFLIILRRLIKRLDMRNPILYFYLPPPEGVIGKFNEKLIIYHSVDEWLTFPAGRNRTFMDCEKKLIEKADLFLAANNILYERNKLYARRIHKIYHGVEYDHFNKEFAKDTPLPDDINNIPKPIIAVIGNFADWMDVDLIRLISRRHNEWSIVSIGPVDPGIDIKSLIKLGNMYFLGQKNYNLLPNYYRAIDVFIIPFLLTEHIRYSAPTRLYEHLSSGKPIVTTDFPAVHEIGDGLINIASDSEDFIKKIEMSLEEKDSTLVERRKSLAKKNTWKARVEEISEIIEEVLRIKRGPQ